jgi:hypothetical protein
MASARVFDALLALYPADYRVRFAAEMRATFAADGRRVWVEIAGLLRAIVVEWTAKLTADTTARARHLPDCRKMRPAGVTRAEWARGLE